MNQGRRWSMVRLNKAPVTRFRFDTPCKRGLRIYSLIPRRIPILSRLVRTIAVRDSFYRPNRTEPRYHRLASSNHGTTVTVKNSNRLPWDTMLNWCRLTNHGFETRATSSWLRKKRNYRQRLLPWINSWRLLKISQIWKSFKEHPAEARLLTLL